MDSRSLGYQHGAIEAKWIDLWNKIHLDVTSIVKDSRISEKKPYYNLMMFPYPSAEGLHVGNMYAFTGSDIYGRYKRMQGYNVFEPIGLDGFGIHSENYALKIGKHPMDHAKVTEKNFYKQLHRIGAMFDWTRTVETYDPSYYRWTQWLFVQMFKHGLAYRGKASVNWCPGCKTVLADEQVVARKATILSDPDVTSGESKDPQRGQNADPRLSLPRTLLRGGDDDKGREDDDMGDAVSVCERCGNKVEKRLLEQWFFRITAYAEKLLENIVGSGKTGVNLDWSEKIRVAQQNWIGKKTGINISYKVKDSREEIVCFTTTPVNFATTFLVLSPEHPAVLKVSRKDMLSDIKLYIESSKKNTSEKHVAQRRDKTGVFTGSYAINHVTGEAIPIWISDFVLMSVGTGAIQACPGHDIRDFEFAKTFGLPIRRVVVGPDDDASEITKKEQVFEHGPGKMVHSGFLNGLEFAEAMEKTKEYFEEKGWGKRVVTYHLRDWLISRQRYWGPPIPMIHCENCAKEEKSWFTTKEAKDMSFPRKRESSFHTLVPRVHGDDKKGAVGWYPVEEKDLPVLLPYIQDYKPGDDGIAPLAKHKEFYHVACPECGETARRETDVSDTFLDSSWYFLRYPSVGLDSKTVRQEDGKKEIDLVFQRSESSSEASLPAKRVLSSQPLPWDPEITRRWLPVDMYTGGAEHSVLHLMYSRFVWKALRDWGYLDFSGKAGSRSAGEEPFSRFYAHGLVIKDGAKMSKSKGNVINPDEYIDRYGIDAVRLYLMFMGPFDQGGDFRDAAMEGMHRWINRVWRLITAQIPNPKSQISNKEIANALQKLIIKMTDDMEKRRYNTAIASMMEFTNLVSRQGGALSLEDSKTFLRLLAPFAPFITEELWFQLNNKGSQSDRTITKDNAASYSSIHLASWPKANQSHVQVEPAIVVVQVNGKVRDTLSIDKKVSQSQSEIEALAKNSPKVQKFFEGKKISRVIFVPGKVINFVVL